MTDTQPAYLLADKYPCPRCQVDKIHQHYTGQRLFGDPADHPPKECPKARPAWL